MKRSERGERLQQHQVERPLQNVSLRRLSVWHANDVSRVPLEGQMFKFSCFPKQMLLIS
jgi:hypothetical protein